MFQLWKSGLYAGERNFDLPRNISSTESEEGVQEKNFEEDMIIGKVYGDLMEQKTTPGPASY